MITNTKLVTYIDAFDHSSIDGKRQDLLKSMARDLAQLYGQHGVLKLMFVCTHNSRRSHISQLWAAAMAKKFELNNIETYSAGTEATAFNPRAVAAMKDAGFLIESDGVADNPHYEIRINSEDAPIVAFSKTIKDASNPTEGFVAMMTCSEADNDCPIVEGALKRYSLHYRDPKEADGTPEESQRYAERCQQIGTEISYLFSRLVEHG
ncbi:MAG: protein-tyrosine-phosphatase [Cyclobacteriaceae bacterium]